ncbi:MAG: glycosyltransferase family 2 protein [Bacteroidales bacterium]|jgi:glycosyltransferase involved in cell wall biosynthesis|nr:glycosyltransferase family 2 protein [Bacteroidales bacterium]
MNISVVVPLLNEEESLPELSAWIHRVCEQHSLTYEIIMVDDGSTDRSWEIIEELHSQNPQIKGIKFRRNYGKSAALNMAFAAVEGDVVITMDADLQDSPDEIPEFYQMITVEKYDVVSGWKKKRYDNVFAKNIPSKLFNWTTRRISKIQLHDFNCGLKAYRKDVIKNIEIYGEMHRYIPVIAKWAGFGKIGEKVVQHQKRKYGTSKFGWSRFINGYLDLMTLTFTSRFGKKPMHFFGLLGTFAFLLGIISAIWVIIEKLVQQHYGEVFRPVTEQPLFFIAILAMIIGSQFFLAGYVGELIARSSGERNKYQIERKIL